jgi:hypothetical protein
MLFNSLANIIFNPSRPGTIVARAGKLSQKLAPVHHLGLANLQITILYRQ